MKTKITPFGIYFKQLRKKKKQTLTEAADLLGVSISYISSVEHGKREIPTSWFDKISNAYLLSEEEKSELKKSIVETPYNGKISLEDIEKCFENIIKSVELIGGDPKPVAEMAKRFIENLKKDRL